jgi:hypothetical protein
VASMMDVMRGTVQRTMWWRMSRIITVSVSVTRMWGTT